MAVMEEEDLDAVAEAWGGEDEELVPGEPTQGLNEDMEGFEDAGANGEEDEEGGWDMEVTALSALYCSVRPETWLCWTAFHALMMTMHYASCYPAAKGLFSPALSVISC